MSSVSGASDRATASGNATKKDSEAQMLADAEEDKITASKGTQDAKSKDGDPVPLAPGVPREPSIDSPALRSLGPWGKDSSSFQRLQPTALPKKPHERKASEKRDTSKSEARRIYPKGAEGSDSETRKANEEAVKNYINLTRGSHDSYDNKIHRIARRASRVPSPSSESGSSCGEGSDEGSDKEKRNAHTAVLENNEIRLRVDESAPISLQFNGDMEGRTLQLLPAGNGMADIVIGKARGGESAYRSARGSIQRRHREPLLIDNRPRKSPVQTAEGKLHGSRAWLDDRKLNEASSQSLSPEQHSYKPPVAEDYYSDDSSGPEFLPGRTTPSIANISRGVRRPVSQTAAPSARRQLTKSDIRSDSGYSSISTAASISTHSAPSATAVTLDAVPNESQHPASDNIKRPLNNRRRPVLIQHRRGENCTDPKCTQCLPTASPQHRPNVLPPDQHVKPSGSTTYYRSPPPATYAPQHAYMQGPAIVQPARTRRHSTSTNRPRPMSYSGEPSQQYGVPGMPPPYPIPPHEHGPPPAASAYHMIPQPPPRYYGMPELPPRRYNRPKYTVQDQRETLDRRPDLTQRRPVTYNTPPARVIVNHTKDERQRRPAVYDRMHEQFATARAIEERRANAKEREAQVSDQTIGSHHHEARTREEQYVAEIKQKERNTSENTEPNNRQGSHGPQTQFHNKTERTSRTSVDESSSGSDRQSRGSLRIIKRRLLKRRSAIPISTTKTTSRLSPNAPSPADGSTDKFIGKSSSSTISHLESSEAYLGATRLPSPVLHCSVKGCSIKFTGDSRHASLARHMAHEHQRPSSPKAEPRSLNNLSTGGKSLSILMDEEIPDHDSLVGLPGMPPQAARPTGSEFKFTPEDNQLIIDLKEARNLSWKQLADFFPGCSIETLQARYHTKLNRKKDTTNRIIYIPPLPPSVPSERGLAQNDMPPSSTYSTANEPSSQLKDSSDAEAMEWITAFDLSETSVITSSKQQLLGIDHLVSDTESLSNSVSPHIANQDVVEARFQKKHNPSIVDERNVTSESVDVVSESLSPTRSQHQKDLSSVPFGIKVSDSEPSLEIDVPVILRCGVENCDAVYQGVDRKGQLARHTAQNHRAPYSHYPCEDKDCDLVYFKLDARLAHYQKKHPELALGFSSRLRRLSSSMSLSSAANEETGNVGIEIQDTSREKSTQSPRRLTTQLPLLQDGYKVPNPLARKGATTFVLGPHTPPITETESEEFNFHATNIEEELHPTQYVETDDISTTVEKVEHDDAGGAFLGQNTEPDNFVLFGEMYSKASLFTDKHSDSCATCNHKLSSQDVEFSHDEPLPGVPKQLPAKNLIRCASCRSHIPSGDSVDIELHNIESLYQSATQVLIRDEDDNMSVVSSYAASVASVFSVESLASSASDLSKASGYSAVQIATATKELLSVFHDDQVLLPLYKSAMQNPSIGPERLQRNLRRLFTVYSEHLGSEAKDRLEYLASRLVALKARWLALSIIDKLQDGLASPKVVRSEHCDESTDEDGEEECEQGNTRPVHEDVFEDFVVLREFLVGSEAFKTLRLQVQAFVVPKPPRNENIGATELTSEEITKHRLTRRRAHVSTWTLWVEEVKQTVDGMFHEKNMLFMAKKALYLSVDALMLLTDDILIATGQLEPALEDHLVRLRWQCTCGDSLYSDVTELREGGLAELIANMQRTPRLKVCATPYNQRSSNQRYIVPRPVQLLKKAFNKILSALGQTPKKTAGLPQHNASSSATVCPVPDNTQSQQQNLHLLACMHRNRHRKVLQQDRLEDVTTDRTLLCFLRQQYLRQQCIRYRVRFLHMISLKHVKGIFFVKFRLPIGGSVDVRHHNPCCVVNSAAPTACECIPPPPKVEPSPTAEYRCIPGPPATYPPVPPEYLSSLFTCPTDVHKDDTWILDQLPKRTCGKLQGEIGQPAEGWGIYYQEGWDRDMIALVVFLIFVLASLLFGILWSRFKFDVQGAFGVSAYMCTASGILVTLIATRAERIG